MAKLDLESIRNQFPVLHQEVNGKPLIYFDNAATTQKPKRVIDALVKYYEHDNANIHRAAHTLASRSTEYFEKTRQTVQQFINAREAEECIFTKGVTESINLVAQTWGRKFLKAGDEIIITTMEHHSNIVPWQMICEETGSVLKVIPINDAGELVMPEYDKLLSNRTKMVACVWVSNALGTVNPVKEIITKAHAVGAKVLLDGAQACSHLDVDVQDLDCDFLAVSSHKLYGPTGVGVLYGKREILESMPPYQGGGEMIKEVTFAKTTYNEIPYKFEAGTPNIADVIAFQYALEFVQEIGKPSIASHENELLKHFTEGVNSINQSAHSPINLIGTAQQKVSVQSFTFNTLHHFDAGMMLDAKGIAVRTGHHCTQPLMHRFGLEGTVRASFAVYNTRNEIDVLLDALERLNKL
ncbi:MAG: cysteine desulfurase [Bacteroidia bacterium]|nr:cysteine desulfurase [Bacteroidia bacterium]MBP7259649.1 cysteine desulfurase [Bacteroidia bacterium]MBP9179346.1 cysteine desulfurase [Bacteroidia bacterium]MBP9723400.1 cysteine desulfurase [Bacteroidia bacterium]